MKTLSIVCVALCFVGLAAWGKDWVFIGAVTTKADWQAADTNWKSGQIALKSLEWLPGDAKLPEATAKPYVAYWLTNQALGKHVEYVDLILTRKPLAELPALSQPTNQPILESDALIVTTYARDSIWNVDLRPFKPLTGVEMVGTNFIVIKGVRFEYARATLEDVLRLLQNPVGKIRIHMIHAGAAGQEEEVRTLAARLLQQLASAKPNQPGAPPPVLPYPVISWDRAVQLIRSGEVVSIGQRHSLDVSLRTKDGATYFTKEPRIDEVFRVVKEQAPSAPDKFLQIDHSWRFFIA